MKAANIILLVAVLSWLGVTVWARMTERSLDLMEAGALSVYTDGGSSSANSWRWEDPDKFTCLFLESNGTHFCGLNIQLDKGNQTGADLSAYSQIRLAMEYRGTADKFRISFRNGFRNATAATEAKFHQFVVPLHNGVYSYNVPFDKLGVAEWWLERMRLNSEEYTSHERNNVLHLGFDIETPMPVGQHYFRIIGFKLVAPWLNMATAGRWAIGSLMYFGVVGLLYNFFRLRVQLKVRSEEMFGLLNKLEKVDTETAHFKRLSMYDPLTGLLNRRAAEDLVNEFASHRSLVGTALIVMDIDHFKRVNDNFGHDVGDEVLKATSAAVRQVLREGDAAIRWGGEEIMVICPKTSSEGAMRVAEKLRMEIKQLRFAEASLNITASFGVAAIESNEGFDQTMRRADEALYQSKHGGRDRVTRAAPASGPSSR